MSAAATFGSTTLEGQVNEGIELLRAKQRDTTVANVNNATMITSFTTNDLTNIRTVTLQYAVSDTVDATDGSIDTIAVEVFDV